MLRIPVIALACLVLPAQEQAWKAFGERVMLSAPASVRNGSDLDKARYVTHMVANRMAAQGIPPNATFGGRLRAVWSSGVRHADRGSCGHVAEILEGAFRGAGIKSDLRGIVAEPKGVGRYNVADVNRDHGALAMVSGGKVFLFDPWQYGRTRGSYAGMGPLDAWNGMELDTWTSTMRKQGYSTFSLVDGGAIETWRAQETRAQELRARLQAKGTPRPTEPPRSSDGARTQEDRELLACFKAWAEDGIPERNRNEPGANYAMVWLEGPRIEGDKVIFAYSLTKEVGEPGKRKRQSVFSRGVFNDDGSLKPGQNWFSVGEVRGLCSQYKARKRR